MLKRDEEEVVRRRWTPAAARAALAKWKASGLTKTAFVEQHGFTLERLRRWEKRLAEGGGSEPVRLVPLVARGASPPTSGVSAKLQMPVSVRRISNWCLRLRRRR